MYRLSCAAPQAIELAIKLTISLSKVNRRAGAGTKICDRWMVDDGAVK
jgi:hypothetical protein